MFYEDLFVLCKKMKAIKKITVSDTVLLNLISTVLIIAITVGCKSKPASKEDKIDVKKGTFAYDLEFLNRHYTDLVVLEDGKSGIIVAPALQARVMTSTANGPEGQSFGWINYDLIASGERLEHFNPLGGEERFWLGPEGGQFSIYFKAGTAFEFNNWYVPKELDTESFELLSSTSSTAHFEKKMQLVNYSGTTFDIKVDRSISLLPPSEMRNTLGITLPESVKAVGFETVNTLMNTGQNTWDKDSGMLSVWILSMFNPSDSTTVIIPFKAGDTTRLGKIATDDYFGKVAEDRLVLADSVLLFKADGRERGKIGISPLRARPFMGSFNAGNNVLTIARFTLPEGKTDYVNSQWAYQENPFKGDAVNAYNDGPLEKGSQLGPFYELESSSPAAALQPGEKLTHVHQTYHFEGDLKTLNTIALQLLGISLENLKL